MSTTPTTVRKTSGFTLIETLVAITVLTIAIVGPYSIANTAIVASRTSQNELVGSYLAQEAVEFVRATRDDNLLARLLVPGEEGRQWLSGLDVCMTEEGCAVDAAALHIIACGGAETACPPLFLSEYGLYNQQQLGTKTMFTRTVRITGHYSYIINEATVSVTVSWMEHGTARSYTLEEKIYDWLYGT